MNWASKTNLAAALLGATAVLAAPGAPPPEAAAGAKVVMKFATGGADPVVCDFMVATVFLDRQSGAFQAGYAAMPLFGSATYSLKAADVTLSGTSLKASFGVPIGWPGEQQAAWYGFSADCTVEAGTIKGAFIMLHQQGNTPKVSTKGTVSGEVSAGPEEAPTANAFSPGTDWPRWRGPFNSGCGVETTDELIDDFGKARLLWRSDRITPDSYAADARGVHHRDSVYIGGGYASPVIVGGRVYLYYYAPNGEYLAEGTLAGNRLVGGYGKEKWAIEADDVIHCLDARTGGTVWKTAFKETAINMQGFSKHGGLLGHGYADGKVYAAGPGGAVLCVDAETGEPVWQSNVDERWVSLRHARDVCIRDRGLLYYNRDFGSALTIADGVVAVNDAESHYRGPRHGNGLMGYDGQTGRWLWHIRECVGWWGCPQQWKHRGKEYIVTPGGEKGVTCIEPKTGRVLWTLQGQGGSEMCAVSEDYLAWNGTGGGLTCYRITPEGATKLWTLDPKVATLSGGGHAVIHNGHVYTPGSGGMVCVELESGKVVGTVPGVGGGFSSHILQNGRLIVEGLYMLKVDPKDFRMLCGPWQISWAHSTTPAISDGRLFVRGPDALYCYDLRKGDARQHGDGDVAMLVKTLGAKDPHLVTAAAYGLSRMGQAGLEALAKALDAAFQSKNGTMFNLLSHALQSQGSQGRAAASPALLKALDSLDGRFFKTSLDQVMADSAEAKEKAKPSLVKALQSRNPALWSDAAAAMIKIDPANEKDVVTALLGALQGPDAKAVTQAVGLLAGLAAKSNDEKTRKSVLAGLMGVIDGRISDAKKAAADALSGFGAAAKEALPALEKLVMNATTADAREAARQAIEKIKPGHKIDFKPKSDAEEKSIDEI